METQISNNYYIEISFKLFLIKLIKYYIHKQMQSDTLFKIEDINSIIKLFAFSIQERFQEIDGIPKSNSDNVSQYLGSELLLDTEHMIRKYRNYTTSVDQEVKYLEKFTLRIIQILDFFKQRSKSQQILCLIIKRIEEKLNKIVKSLPIDVECLYSYVIYICKYGFYHKTTKQKKLTLKRPQTSQLRAQQNNTKKERLSQEIEEAKINSNSVQMGQKGKRSISLSAKKMFRTPLAKEKQNIQLEFVRMYSILEVDVKQLQKMVDCRDRSRLQKQSNKQNLHIGSVISSYEKAYNNLDRKKDKNEAILKQVYNRSSIRPTVNNWVSRKRKFSQCRKRQTDRQNISIV